MHCNATLWDYQCSHIVFMHTALKTIHPLSLFRLHTESTCTLKILDMFSENTQCTFTFSLFFTCHTHAIPTGTHLHKICNITHALFDWQTVFSLVFFHLCYTHAQLLRFLYSVWGQLLQRLHTSHHKAHIVVKSPWIRSGGTSALLCLRSL